MRVFDRKTIEQALQTKWAAKTVHFAEQTDSTNLWARRLAENGAEHGTLCVAAYQCAGRGSRSRTWTAEPGTSVMMSLLLRPELLPEDASMLTLVMGLAVARALNGLQVKAGIKWPNDVVLSGKKVCGILTEMRLESGSPDQIKDVVIGTGINVNVRAFPEELADKATSMLIETGRTYSLPLVIANVLMEFEEAYELFMQKKNLSFIRSAYEELLLNKNQPVRILDSPQPDTGVALGIDERGCLLVQCAGEIRRVNAGEVSVRGLYSYV